MCITVEKFRARNNLSVEETCDIFYITYDAYDEMKDKDVTFYAKDGRMEELLERDSLVNKKWNEISEEVFKLDDRSFELLYNLIDSFICTRKKTEALV